VQGFKNSLSLKIPVLFCNSLLRANGQEAAISNGMNLLHILSDWQRIVIGTIILLAVILDMSQKKRKV